MRPAVLWFPVQPAIWTREAVVLSALLMACASGGASVAPVPLFVPPPGEPGEWHVGRVSWLPVADPYVEPAAGDRQRFVLVEACSGATGRVQSVRHVSGGDATASEAARRHARQMAFRPRQAPFCQRMEMRLKWTPASEKRASNASGPVMLSPSIGRGLCVSCPEPQRSSAAGASSPAILKICVAETGEVSAVKLLHGDGDQGRLAEAVRSWKLRPFVREDRPLPFCFSERFP